MRAALALAVLIVASSAAAQTKPPAPQAAAPEPAAPQSLPPQPFRSQGLADAFAGGLSTPIPPLAGFKPLQGLSAVGDQAPQCRAACTRARSVCGDEQECSDRWRQCVRRCATPTS